MSSSSLSDPYASSYYTSLSYSLVNQGLGEGVWNNQADPMSFLNGYGGQLNNSDQSHYMDGMFGQSGFNAYNTGYNYFSNAGGADNSGWGNSNLTSQKTAHGPYQDDYYRESYNPAVLRHVEQGIGGLSITVQNDAHSGKDTFGKSTMLHGNVVKNQFTKKFNTTMNDGMVLNNIPGISGQLTAPKKLSWANVASQPAKPQAKVKPKPIQSLTTTPESAKQSTMDIGTWESKHGNKSPNGTDARKPTGKPKSSINWNLSQANKNEEIDTGYIPPPHPSRQTNASDYTLATEENYPSHPVLDKLRKENNYNPKDFDLNPKIVKFFIIKSYSEDDIHRSIKYSIWCSTEHGNKRLDQAYRDAKGAVYLFYSVNGSGHFCGMAQMVSQVDYQNTASVWAQNKWKGQFKVKWIYVKDVPNSQLRHIRLENNENKPITNSRDTQEVPPEKGKQMMKIMHNFRHTTSIFDDFLHYEKRQDEDDQRKPQQ